MKRILLLLAGVCIALMLNAQVSKTVNVTAGGLFSALTSTELSTVTNLIITGTIDARDFKTMRDNMPALADIDISGTTIAAYSGNLGTYTTGFYHDYGANWIPDFAFYNYADGVSKTSLRSILLPSSITYIHEQAFRGCTGLLSVTIPALVTAIGANVFLGCTGLTSVTIPSSVTFISEFTFSGCTGLTSVTIPSSVSSIGRYAFQNCSGLLSVTTKKTVPVDLSSSLNVFNGVNKVNCTLYVPYKAKVLYAVANQWMDFTNITEMPGFVISGTAFNLASDAGSAASVNITSNITWTASSNQEWLTASPLSGTGSNTLTLTAQANTSIETRMASVTISATGVPSQTISITQVGIPKTVNVTAGSLFSALTVLERSTITRLLITGTIDARDFKTMRDNMPMLADIDISGTTITAYSGTGGTYNISYNYLGNWIPVYAFFNSSTFIAKTSLKSIMLPTSITSIGTYAFRGCTGLLSVTIPALVTTIGEYAFQNCTSLTAVIFSTPSSVSNIGNNAFENCTSLTSVTIPASITAIGSSAFLACGLTSVNFSTPSTISTIGNSAFNNCTNLASVDIPISVTSIGFASFQRCTGLTSVNFSTPSSLTIIGGGAFNNCSKLTSIVIPTSVTTLGEGTFQDCTGLTSVNFSTPSSLTTIGDYTFKSCSKLVSIDIPTSVTTLGAGTFRGCIVLTTVSFSTPSLVSSIGYDAFNGCNKLASFTIPGSVTTIQDNAFLNCTGLTELIFSTPSLLKTIGYSAFRNCAKLTSLTIPTSVTSIEDQAFGYCSGLNSINFSTPSSITTFGIGVFVYCTGLTSVTIPTSVTTIARSVFFGCTGLTSVTIPKSVNSIGRDVFYNCSGLLSITTQNPVPVDLSSSSNVFYGVNKVNCTLYVPYTAKVQYAAANQWMDFSTITEMPGFKLSETAFNLSSEAGTEATVNVTSDVIWTASTSQSWLSASPSSGSGSNTLTLTAQANTSLEARVSIVTISATGVPSQPITVTQAGAPKILDVTAVGLFSALTAPERSTITKLVITGTIDARDFKTMRDNMPMLESIDISQAAIVAYSGTQGTFAADFIYDGDAIPINAFYLSSTNTSKTILKSIQMPQSVKVVMHSAFYGCTGLTSVNITSSVISIGNGAFALCSGLTSVNIPSSVTTIGQSAFYNCTGLTSVNIPSSVISIGVWAFYNCTGLTSITTDKIVPVDLSSSENVFAGVNKSTCILYVPYKSTLLYAAADQWKDFTNMSEMSGFKLSATALTLAAEAGSAASVNITSDVTWTASSNQDWLTVNPLTGSVTNTLTLTVLANTSVATRIANVVISSPGVNSQTITIAQVGVPKTVNVTAGGLFSALTTLERSTITRLVVTGTIDARDFKTMSDSMPLLAELDLSGANIAAYSGTEGTAGNYFVSYPINAIPNSAFFSQSYQAKKSLVSIQLPLSITSIDEFAFYYCSGLTTVTIPAKVSQIGWAAFLGCTGLTSVNFSLPSSLSVIGNSAFKACTGLTSVTLPSSLTTISVYAFEGCTGLTTVTIPESVTAIQSLAFLGCSGLTSIIAENPVPVDLSSSVSVFAGVNKTTCKLYVPYEAKVLYAAADQWKDFLNITEMAFRFSPKTATIASAGGSTVTIDIATNIGWSASSDQAWLTVSPASGTGNNTLTFTAQANPQNKSRFATITVSAPGVDSQTIIITQQANDINNVPVANAGTDQTVDINVKVTLDGSASTDADGNQLTYKWSAPEGITLSSITVVKPEFTAPVVTTNTTYTFTLVVNDGTVDSPADQITVTVRKPNIAPVANAGPDQSVNEGSSVSLDGTASSDTDGNPLTYLWAAPAGITLSSTTTDKPTFTAPEVNTDTQYTFSLVVNDGTMDSPADQITVTVRQVNKAPVANAGPDLSADEGAVVTLDDSASTDADGNPLTYKWTAPNGITLNSTTVAKPWFTAPEVTTNTNYTFTLVVNDGTVDSPADQIVITVRQLNIAPVANAGADQTGIDAGAIVTLDGSASTDADGNPLTYEWTAPAGITLNSTTVAKSWFTAPGVATNTNYTFTLVVNDGLLNSNTASVTINVKALIILSSEAQIVKATGAGIDSAKVEQASSQVILYTAYGADPRSLAPTFQISLKAVINPASGSIRDFSSPVNYTVTAEDGTTKKVYSVRAFVPTVTLKRALASGWNWISLSNTPPDLKVGPVLGSLSLVNLDYIKSGTTSAVYYTSPGWFGDLTNLPQLEMLMFKKATSQVFTLTGKEINPTLTSIPFSTGWNRIGYILKGNAALGGAFETASLPTGDILLKSKEASAIYYPASGWIGDLDSLRVLNGYMMKTASSGEIKYKASSAKLKSAQQTLFNWNELYTNYQINPPLYEHSANLIGELVDQKGENMIRKGDLLIAYSLSEPRGVTEARFVPDLNRYVFLLTMFSNSNQDKISFKVRLLNDGLEKPLSDELIFSTDQVFGQALNPYPLQLASTTGIDKPGIDQSIDVYPNPVGEKLQIRSDNMIQSVVIAGLSGNCINILSNLSEYTLLIDTRDLVPGMYILKIETLKGTFIRKLIKSSN